MIGRDIKRTARISKDEQYRYQLGRHWDRTQARKTMFVMLNPSTANAFQDDATIRRCMNFADSWGCGGMYVVNLFALRATDPMRLLEAKDPVGPKNDSYLRGALVTALKKDWLTVVAWGKNAPRYRTRTFARMMAFGPPVWCLGVNADGSPRHPLRLSKFTPLERWSYPL